MLVWEEEERIGTWATAIGCMFVVERGREDRNLGYRYRLYVCCGKREDGDLGYRYWLYVCCGKRKDGDLGYSYRLYVCCGKRK